MARNIALLEQYDDLPEDLLLLRQLIRTQAEIIQLQRLEAELLINENRGLRRKYRTLRQLICPPN